MKNDLNIQCNHLSVYLYFSWQLSISYFPAIADFRKMSLMSIRQVAPKQQRDGNCYHAAIDSAGKETKSTNGVRQFYYLLRAMVSISVISLIPN